MASASRAWVKTSSTVSASLFLAADDPPIVVEDKLARQGHHQIVPVVPECGKPVLRQLALDSEGALQLLRHQFEGVGL